jgi:LacI family transcriptional regulator
MKDSFTKTRPTIADLARAAGVGISTVDRVLNGRHPVRRPTAERVLAAAEAIGFHGTSAIRRRLGSERPERTLGFILQERATPFYRLLGEALALATTTAPMLRGRPVVDHFAEITPTAVAERLLQVGKKVDAVAIVAADHPYVTNAIDELRGRGVPVLALISDLSAESRAGFVGLDSRKLGRTAAWAMRHLARRPGEVGIVVGSHRFLCQELSEMSFRSYFREHAPNFHLREPLASLEDTRLAHESTLDLLRRTPDLVGLFVAGGGIEGVILALREADAAGRVTTIGLDLTDVTRKGLIDGTLSLVLSHPQERIARAAVSAMATALENGGGEPPSETLLPFDVFTPENI